MSLHAKDYNGHGNSEINNESTYRDILYITTHFARIPVGFSLQSTCTYILPLAHAGGSYLMVL